MIVPVILNYNFTSKKKYEGLWIFYKFLDFCKKNDTCIIGRECYYNDPKTYEGSWDLDKNVLKMYDYEYPSTDFLKFNKNFMIEENVEKELMNNSIGWSYLLINRCEPLEKAINDSLDKIEKSKKQKIDIIITWYPFKSLEYLCKKRKIKLLSVEFSGIRKEWYNITLSSISLKNKYNSFYDVKKIKDVNFNDKLILTREELITLFSYTNDLFDNLKMLKSSPIYEIGYALGLENDPYENAFCSMQQKDVIKSLKDTYDEKQLLFRLHPQLKAKVVGNIDNSNTSREFISKCNKLVIMVSNVGYEAMLFGKKVSYLNKKFLTALNNENTLTNLNDSSVSLEKLNFITFGLYTLFENLFNPIFLTDFANERVDINDFYTNNIKQIFKKFNLNYQIMKRTAGKSRINYMLKQIHNLKEKDIEKIEGLNYSSTFYEKNICLKGDIKKLNKEIKKLKEDNNKKTDEIDYLSKKVGDYSLRLNEISNSRIWIFAEKFRKIKNKVLRRN